MSAAPALEVDDEACLAGALARDLDRAFECFVMAYRSRIVTFVARMLHDDAAAEDVAQDVFVRAYRALQTYAPERRAELRLRSWLYAIAHNLTRNTFRGPQAPAGAIELRHVAAEELGPEQLVLRSEEWTLIEAAIASLTTALRPAFVMRYIDDLSYDEIAASLEQPIGTVKASAHRGLLAVRAYLEEDHV